MRWEHKATIMKLFANLPLGDRLYRLGQKSIGRLDANPMSRLALQIEMARWILDHGMIIEGKRFFEVGTGHKPIVPIGLYLSGAESVITVDLHRRLDFNILKRSLFAMIRQSEMLESMYLPVIDRKAFRKRFVLLCDLWSQPHSFLKEAGIRYIAPSDATATGLPASSIDYHFSISVLEHIPLWTIRGILSEAVRILDDRGAIIHFVDTSDHFQHQDTSITKINFLRFDEKEWLRIADNEYAYCNRLRPSDFLAIASELPCDILRIATTLDDEAMRVLEAGFPLSREFKAYAPEDICVTVLKIMLGKKTCSGKSI